MTTLRKWLEEFASQTGEKPSVIVFGWDHGWGDYARDNGWPEWDRWARVTDYDNVPADILDHEFDDGYGGTESPNMCGWSPSWVLFSDMYDGAEAIQWVPRNPIDHEPIRPGG